jgi:cytochrome c-type biogenesis protein CcmE
MAGKTKFFIAGLLIVVAVGYLIVSSTGDTAHYFLTIEELQAMGDETLGRSITVSGVVLGDTIAYDPTGPRVIFTIVQVPADPKKVEQAGGVAAVRRAAVNDPDAPRLEVVYDGVKPDLLQHEAQPIIRGRLGEDGRFYAEEILLKCPSRYEEEVPSQSEGP